MVGFPNKHGFSLLKMIMTWGGDWGYHHLRKHPYKVDIFLFFLGISIFRIEVSTSIFSTFLLLDYLAVSYNGNIPCPYHDGSMGGPVYLDTLKVEFYGKLVGKYTGPMDPSWVIKCRLLGGAFFKILLF